MSQIGGAGRPWGACHGAHHVASPADRLARALHPLALSEEDRLRLCKSAEQFLATVRGQQEIELGADDLEPDLAAFFPFSAHAWKVIAGEAPQLQRLTLSFGDATRQAACFEALAQGLHHFRLLATLDLRFGWAHQCHSLDLTGLPPGLERLTVDNVPDLVLKVPESLMVEVDRVSGEPDTRVEGGARSGPPPHVPGQRDHRADGESKAAGSSTVDALLRDTIDPLLQGRALFEPRRFAEAMKSPAVDVLSVPGARHRDFVRSPQGGGWMPLREPRGDFGPAVRAPLLSHLLQGADTRLQALASCADRLDLAAASDIAEHCAASLQGLLEAAELPRRLDLQQLQEGLRACAPMLATPHLLQRRQDAKGVARQLLDALHEGYTDPARLSKVAPDARTPAVCRAALHRSLAAFAAVPAALREDGRFLAEVRGLMARQEPALAAVLQESSSARPDAKPSLSTVVPAPEAAPVAEPPAKRARVMVAAESKSNVTDEDAGAPPLALSPAQEDACVRLVRQQGLLLQALPAALRTPAVCLAAVTQDCAAFACVPAAARAAALRALLPTHAVPWAALSPPLAADMEAVLVEWAGDLGADEVPRFPSIPATLQTPAICEAAVGFYGPFLRHVREDLRSNALCRLALEGDIDAEDWDVYDLLAPSCRADAALLMEVLEKDASQARFMGPRLQEVLAAVPEADRAALRQAVLRAWASEAAGGPA